MSEFETCLRAVRQGDVAALSRYIDLRRSQLLQCIERRLGPGLRRKLEPEDILQEISAEACRRLPRTNLGEQDPFLWLCRLAERRIIDAHRRFFGARKRDAAREVPLAAGSESRPGLIDQLVASMTSPSEAFSLKGRERRLRVSLESLPAPQREALRMRYVDGLSSAEIAEHLHKSEGAIRVLLSRSLKRLQTLLGPTNVSSTSRTKRRKPQ